LDYKFRNPFLDLEGYIKKTRIKMLEECLHGEGVRNLEKNLNLLLRENG
jgi:hypothetical protein